MQRWQGDAAILLCALVSLFMLQVPSGNAAAADIVPYRVEAASRHSPPISGKARLERFSGFLREGRVQAPSSTLRLRGAGGAEVTHESNFELQSGNRFFSKVRRADLRPPCISNSCHYTACSPCCLANLVY
jgi:hypothetical protein